MRKGSHYVLLLLVVFLGAVLRLDFMQAVGFSIDSDEAIVGLMGKHILEGRPIPVFYYGQHYMGSLEGLMAAASFALFGVTPFALQLVPLVCSLLCIVLMFFLGQAVMSTRAGLVAALFMSCAPPALLVWSAKARGGFVEVLVLGILAMLVCIRWIRSSPDKLGYPVLLGLLLGLGWWVNNQIVYFIAPIAIVSGAHLWSGRRLASNAISVPTNLGATGRVIALGVISFLVGGLPYWVYNIRLGFPSVGMFGVVKGEVLRQHLDGLIHVALPMIFGAQRFWQKATIFPGAKAVAELLYVVPVITIAAVRWRSVLGLFRGSLDRQRPVELLLLQCVACVGIFAISSFGGLVQAPRYLLPLYVGLYALLGVWCDALMKRQRFVGWVFVVAVLTFQLMASYYGGRGVGGEPFVYAGHRVARDHGPILEVLQRLGISHVRTNYWIGYRLAFESNERVTFSQIGEPFQIRIPEYEAATREEREVWPLVLVRAQVPAVTLALSRMGFSFQQTSAGEYVVVYDIGRAHAKLQSLTLDRTEYTLEASGTQDPYAALDGRDDTRWGTASPQAPEQRFAIEFVKPPTLHGIGYTFSRWWPDRPREFRIEVEDINGKREVVLSPFEAKGAFELSIREGSFTIQFGPKQVRRVIFSQLGRDSVFDWSIAELSFFGSPEGNS
jgi:hypothetical protein